MFRQSLGNSDVEESLNQKVACNEHVCHLCKKKGNYPYKKLHLTTPQSIDPDTLLIVPVLLEGDILKIKHSAKAPGRRSAKRDRNE